MKCCNPRIPGCDTYFLMVKICVILFRVLCIIYVIPFHLLTFLIILVNRNKDRKKYFIIIIIIIVLFVHIL
jgi:hypothetical protein